MLSLDIIDILNIEQLRSNPSPYKLIIKWRREPDLNRQGLPQRFSRPPPYQVEPSRHMFAFSSPAGAKPGTRTPERRPHTKKECRRYSHSVNAWTEGRRVLRHPGECEQLIEAKWKDYKKAFGVIRLNDTSYHHGHRARGIP